MPTALLNTVPSELLTSQSGIGVYAWVTRSVMAASDESVGVMQAWFSNQPPLAAKKKHLLSQSLAEWLKVKDGLSDAGAPQSAVQQRLSLEALVSGITEASDTIKALKAASDTAVPVSRYLLKLQGLAEKYASVLQAEAKVATVTAFAAHAAASRDGGNKSRRGGRGKGKGKGKGLCWHFEKNGECWRGAECKFEHSTGDRDIEKEGRKVGVHSLRDSNHKPNPKSSTALKVSPKGVKVASAGQMIASREGPAGRGTNQCCVEEPGNSTEPAAVSPAMMAQLDAYFAARA